MNFPKPDLIQVPIVNYAILEKQPAREMVKELLFANFLTLTLSLFYDIYDKSKKTGIMTMTSTIKEGAKKGAKLWAAKKGLQWTGSILKMGAVAGAGYFAFKFLKRNKGAIKEKFS